MWIACARPAFQLRLAEIQQHLQLLAGLQLVDLHVSDLLNAQLPSHYDYTSQYDLLVFRRLGTGNGDANAPADLPPGPAAAAASLAATPGKTPRRGGPPVLRRIDTSPVGFAVFDRVLLTVHPPDCLVRDTYATRLLAAVPSIPTATYAKAAPARGGSRLRHQPGRPDAARGQPHGRRLPGAAPRTHAPARPLADRAAQAPRTLCELVIAAGGAAVAACAG